MDSLNNVLVPLDELMPLIREQLALDHTVRFSPRGTSMLPMLRQGLDTVTLSSVTGALRKYDLPLYRRKNGQYVLHRVVKVGDSYTCVGDNQFFLEPDVHHDQVIALVTSFSRGGREYSVHSPAYWFYCRFWHFTRPARHLWRRICGLLRRLKL